MRSGALVKRCRGAAAANRLRKLSHSSRRQLPSLAHDRQERRPGQTQHQTHSHAEALWIPHPGGRGSWHSVISLPILLRVGDGIEYYFRPCTSSQQDVHPCGRWRRDCRLDICRFLRTNTHADRNTLYYRILCFSRIGCGESSRGGFPFFCPRHRGRPR